MVVTIIKNYLLLLFIVVAGSLLATSGLAKADAERWFKHQGSAMGTLINVEFWHSDPHHAQGLFDGVMQEMQRIEKSMSPYLEDSELAQINANAFKRAVPISKELFQLITIALQHGQWSDGAFDITFASAGFHYDYQKGIKPNRNRLNEVLPLINYRGVILDKNKRSVRYVESGVKIDLGGIAKGYAVDQAVLYLYRNGIRHGLVSAGGDTRIIGDRLGRPWMLGIKHPRGEGHIISIPLQDISVSTSGDYERYFIDDDGVRHHHILNPQSGRSAKEMQSVTILGQNATMTDALSTTVFVMGVKKGLAYINQLGNVSAIIIDSQGKLHYSRDLVMPVAN